jgi:DNA-binding NarL/FixJ family response regulator
LAVVAAKSFELVGRDEERARLAAFVVALTAGPHALLIRGEPGIGKTVLWREGVRAAQRSAVRVLVSRCAEAELPIPLGAVADLLDPAFEEIQDVLPEPQRRTLAAALGIATDGRTRPDRLAVPRSFLAALRALAEDAPLLLAIDDVQWLDASSARVLAFAARRIHDAPIGVLATLRGRAEQREPLGLAEAFGPNGLSEVELGPLSTGALQHLIGLRLDLRLPRTTLSAVHAASGGNPMFALEFGRVAKDEDARLRPRLPVPASLQELVRERVERLPEQVRPLLELVAAVERPTESLLRKGLDGVGEPSELIEAALAAGAVTIGEDEVVRFSHPLLGSAVYYALSPARRRDLHRTAARLTDDLVQQARHLALSADQPDETTARTLEHAATLAAERGAPDAAAALAASSVRLTPPEDEAARVRRTFVAAGCFIEAGTVDAAREQVAPLLDRGFPVDVRAQALVLRAETEHRDRALLRACLQEAIEIGPNPRIRWDALIRYAQHGGWVSGDARTASESAQVARDIAIELDEPPLKDASTAALAYYEAGRGRSTVEFGEAELRLAERLPRTAPWQITPPISVGSRLLWAGELDRARKVLRAEYDELVRQGSMLRRPLVLLAALFDVEWRGGRLSAANEYAEEARTILDDALPGGAHVVLYARILAAGSSGRVDDARRLAADGIRIAREYDDVVNELRIRWAIGHVELACGDAPAAWRTLDGLPQALAAFGIAEPGWQPVLPDVVDALVQLGRFDEAEAVLQELERQAEVLRHRWAMPAALRCAAVLLLARESADDAAAAAERAASEFQQIGFPLDRARALLVAGAARRRAGQRRRAADALRPAVEILAAVGAQPWLERAEDELRRASPRPRHDGELTNAERGVAALVVQGQTNKEVAARLFTTTATVEAHLTRIYRKLGVRSRTELARAAADGRLTLE